MNEKKYFVNDVHKQVHKEIHVIIQTDYVYGQKQIFLILLEIWECVYVQSQEVLTHLKDSSWEAHNRGCIFYSCTANATQARTISFHVRVQNVMFMHNEGKYLFMSFHVRQRLFCTSHFTCIYLSTLDNKPQLLAVAGLSILTLTMREESENWKIMINKSFFIIVLNKSFKHEKCFFPYRRLLP